MSNKTTPGEYPAFELGSFDNEDLEEILSIESEIYPHPWTRGNFADALNSAYECHAIRQASGEPTAAGRILGYRVTMVILDELHLLNVSVDKQEQGKGLGRWLMQNLIEQGKEQGKSVILLEVRPSNLPALGLYQSLGFELVHTRKGYYPTATGREDALVLKLAP